MVLRVGGSDRLLGALVENDIGLNGYAEEYLSRMPALGAMDIEVELVSVGELGLEVGARLSRIYGRALELGYGLCPPHAAGYLRLALREQELSANSVLSAGKCPDGAINVAAESVMDEDGLYHGLYLRNVDGKLWLRGYVCDDEYIWPADAVFAFRKDTVKS